MGIYLGSFDGIILGPILGNLIGNDDGITLGTNHEYFDVETQQNHLLVLCLAL